MFVRSNIYKRLKEEYEYDFNKQRELYATVLGKFVDDNNFLVNSIKEIRDCVDSFNLVNKEGMKTK